MALTITEEWVRERVQLKHNNLEDVRSLSLPGTYHEKIVSLGDSLRSFTRLKSLDLSRNAIESLAGIENLKILEKLNLYYNNVASLKELNRLRCCTQLQELDLRLNPVARNEPDYRLFLIHMLPNLRNLDDRSVRDNERKAALLHFSTDQASELTEHQQVTQNQQVSKTTNPRVEHVQSLARPSPTAAFNQDDAAVIDLVTRQGGDLGKPRPITGSHTKNPSTSDFPPDVRRHMNLAGVGLEHPPDPQFLPSMPPPSHFNQNGEENFPVSTKDTAAESSNNDADSFAARYPNLAPAIMTSVPSEGHETKHHGQSSQKQLNGKHKVTFGDDPNLRFQDEADAYMAFKAQGHFTPHPEKLPLPSQTSQDAASSQPSQVLTNTESSSHRTVEFYNPDTEPKNTSQPPSSKSTEAAPSPVPQMDSSKSTEKHEEIIIPGEFGRYIGALSSMVDKYWNGNRSLLRNQRFISQMIKLLEEVRSSDEVRANVQPRPSHTQVSLEREVLKLREELRTMREEKAQLREKLISSMSEPADVGAELLPVDENKMKSALIRSQRDLGIVRGRLQKAMEENKALQEKQTGGARTDHVNSSQLETLGVENERLKQDVHTLTIRLKQAGQMQELAAMLQESHKSLVQTNEYLLRDLEEMRLRYEGARSQRTSMKHAAHTS